jgi:MFS-type transporter involved in bile tolerance (Atg22 family)
LLIVFLVLWLGFLSEREKARRFCRRRALLLEISLAALLQAMAVRRHGGSMMVVMAVMAVALHLTQTIK